MPFGRLRDLEGGTDRQALARVANALESAGCEVGRGKAMEPCLEILVPGWDSSLWPLDGLEPLQRLFWDRMTVRVSEGGIVRYRMVYWHGAQPLLHFAITAVFAMQVWWGEPGTAGPGLFFALFAVAHGLCVAATLAGFGLSLNRAACRARA